MKLINELINTTDPGWDLIQEWLKDATNQYEILPKEALRAERELVQAQVTTRSTMGAIIYETGGILIDHGWIRILGSGSPQLDRGIMEWNTGKTFTSATEQPTHLLIADDVIGGYFALNAGGIGDEPGMVYYLPQDTLQWENLGCGYSDFIGWALNGDLQKFYQTFKWKGWQIDLENMNGNQTVAFYPFLWTKYTDFEELSRAIVPTTEHYMLTLDMQKQLGGN